jgi:Uma2 family endonuclease
VREKFIGAFDPRHIARQRHDNPIGGAGVGRYPVCMPLTVPYSPQTPSKVVLDDGTEQPVPGHMTLTEFRAFPWPTESRWELIWEVPILAPRPMPPHQDLSRILANFIDECLSRRPDLRVFLDVDVVLPRGRSVVAPDIVVVDGAQVDTERGPMETTPLLMVEVLSPSNASVDTGPKRDSYAVAGVPEYWIVDPQTCAVAMHVEPLGGVYKQPAANEAGFVRSPLLNVEFKIVRKRSRFQVVRDRD